MVARLDGAIPTAIPSKQQARQRPFVHRRGQNPFLQSEGLTNSVDIPSVPETASPGIQFLQDNRGESRAPMSHFTLDDIVVRVVSDPGYPDRGVKEHVADDPLSCVLAGRALGGSLVGVDPCAAALQALQRRSHLFRSKGVVDGDADGLGFALHA